MHEFVHILEDVLLNAILVTGLVIIMMLMIEFVNISTKGKWFESLRQSKVGGVFLGGLLGLFPGCIGGFATVSLYSHKMLSFGALVAMMIVSSGDESFVMLAMFPSKALILFGILFVIGIVAGLVIDLCFPKKEVSKTSCGEEFAVHECDIEHHHPEGEACTEDCPHRSLKNFCNPGWRRLALLAGEIAFIAALAFGMLEHEHGAEGEGHAGLHIFDEYWINLIFAILSIFVVWFTVVSPRHFIEEHLWKHIIGHHLISIFCWTFGTLLVVETALNFLDISSWVSSNVPFMILLAALVGIIPESGPHLIFVTLFATGVIPFPVLLASSISQDGHSSLPLLAENKKSFVYAKSINVAVALIVGFVSYILF
ncbi:MAG: arsenic efflux protein [Bacteroidales bacterium]|nr:arsenic efflux protein [Bacteroidales bacterium]